MRRNSCTIFGNSVEDECRGPAGVPSADHSFLKGGNSYFIGVNQPAPAALSASTKGLSFASLSAPVDLQLVGDLQQARAAGATVTPQNGGLLVQFNSPQAGSVYNLSFRATDLLSGATTVETLSLKGVAGFVPEPASLASLLVGGALLRRRRSI